VAPHVLRGQQGHLPVTWVCLISFVDIDAKMFKITASQFVSDAKLRVDCL